MTPLQQADEAWPKLSFDRLLRIFEAFEETRTERDGLRRALEWARQEVAEGNAAIQRLRTENERLEALVEALGRWR